MNENKKTFNLFETKKIYRDNTIFSYYFKSNKEIVKTSGPVTINGERFKVDYETGEIRYYKKNEILLNDMNSISRTKRLLDMLLLMNDFDWFATLTFDKSKVDRTNPEVVYDCYKKYINNIKHQYPNFKYICVPEKHEDGCFHFHLLIGGMTPNQLGLVNSGKVCCHWANKKNGICSKKYFEDTKNNYELTETDGLTVFNVTSFIYGLTTVTRIANREKCNSYVKKYLEKAFGSTEVFQKRFFYSSNLNIPLQVKQCIGADFDRIYELDNFSKLEKDIIFQNADAKFYAEKYNVLQLKVDNEKLEYLEKGLIPIDDSNCPF